MRCVSSRKAFSNQFKNPFLKEIIKNFLSPVLFEMFVLSEMDLQRSGYPIGGSLNFSKQFEKKYLELGGVIHYNSKVSKINTIPNGSLKSDKACGITLVNGDTHYSDIVISAMDGKSTIFDLLDGRYVNEKLLDIYKTMELNPSEINITLGINKTYENEPPTILIQLNKPLTIPDGNTHDHIKFRIFNFDPTLAPRGKTLINIELNTKNFEFWSKLRSTNMTEYKKVKEEIAQRVIDILNEHLEGLKENVEMVDVATPATFYRYTGNWNGSIQGWDNSNVLKNKHIKKELPNLQNFYMIGQWVQPGGGVPSCFLSGRAVAQIICKRKKKPFKTS